MLEVDIELLKAQRNTLLDIIQYGNQTAQVVEHLEGLINFLDATLDSAAVRRVVPLFTREVERC
tara:strand:- start:441 stop:632 length:192 start_codon:yes stop_codon:yes gene_type:complete